MDMLGYTKLYAEKSKDEVIEIPLLAKELAKVFGIALSKALEYADKFLKELKEQGIIKSFVDNTYYYPYILDPRIRGDGEPSLSQYYKNKLLFDSNNNRIGYISGNYMSNAIGACSLMTNEEEITSSLYIDLPENALIRLVQAKRPINNDNYLYLQILDFIEGFYKGEIFADREYESVLSSMLYFIKQNELEHAKLFEIAKDYEEKTQKMLVEIINLESY